jgi:hypothetical protein
MASREAGSFSARIEEGRIHITKSKIYLLKRYSMKNLFIHYNFIDH